MWGRRAGGRAGGRTEGRATDTANARPARHRAARTHPHRAPAPSPGVPARRCFGGPPLACRSAPARFKATFDSRRLKAMKGEPRERFKAIQENTVLRTVSRETPIQGDSSRFKAAAQSKSRLRFCRTPRAKREFKARGLAIQGCNIVHFGEMSRASRSIQGPGLLNSSPRRRPRVSIQGWRSWLPGALPGAVPHQVARRRAQISPARDAHTARAPGLLLGLWTPAGWGARRWVGGSPGLCTWPQAPAGDEAHKGRRAAARTSTSFCPAERPASWAAPN